MSADGKAQMTADLRQSALSDLRESASSFLLVCDYRDSLNTKQLAPMKDLTNFSKIG